MSTKTTFKRIALVAVAALGLGVLSVAPSSATVTNLTVTAADGTATTQVSDSTTAASLSINFITTNAGDSVTVTSFVKSKPTLATAPTQLKLMGIDSATATTAVTLKDDASAGHAVAIGTEIRADSVTAIVGASTNQLVAAKIAIYFGDTTTVALKAGTYVITTIITPFAAGVAGTPITKDINIVVSAVAAESKVASSVGSTLTDPNVSSAVATVSSTNVARATMTLTLLNAAGGAAAESVTATITGPGTIGSGQAVGKSVVLAYTGATTISIYSDGTAGTSSISVSTPSLTFAAKSIAFYGK
jgi:hypothetical protein